MLNNKNINNIDEKNFFENKLSLKKVDVETLNNLLNSEKDNKEEFFQKLEEYIENAKNIYKSLNNEENNEKLIVLFLENICFLINNLNIKRVHNRSCGLELREYSSVKDLEEYFRIRGKNILEDNKKGFSCNNINIWIYSLLEEIIGEENINSTFLLNKKDNHGRIVFRFPNNDYTLDSNEQGVFFIKNKHNNSFFRKIDNKEKYKKKVIEQEKEYNVMKYQYGKYVLILKKNNDKINIYYVKEYQKKSNNRIIRKIKNYFYQKKNKIFEYNKGKFKNINDLITEVGEKLGEKDEKIIKQIFGNLNQEKLKQFI